MAMMAIQLAMWIADTTMVLAIPTSMTGQGHQMARRRPVRIGNLVASRSLAK